MPDAENHRSSGAVPPRGWEDGTDSAAPSQTATTWQPQPYQPLPYTPTPSASATAGTLASLTNPATPSTVLMRAPNGKVAPVPPEMVEQYTKLGAVVVQG